MRVNIYNEELTGELERVTATPDTGRTFTGLRFLLASADELHRGPADDDRSAVTFWTDDPGQLAVTLRTAAAMLDAGGEAE